MENATTQNQLSEILDNILGLLLLEGSYEIQEDDSGVRVAIETSDAGRLIGFKGESLNSLQLLISQLLFKKTGQYQRVIIDVSGWRQNKEKELSDQAKTWAGEVLESGKPLELEPMVPWQRRIVHMAVAEVTGVESVSVGEGRDRHLIIRPFTSLKVK
ncbi:KH domain-containing protein [Candidatus Daviesbacteria bacterium]|nr:KH domain-containing protein [Candidatus Daviesbacteria bacterium]